MPSTLRSGLLWLFLVLVPAGWIGLSMHEEGDRAAASATAESHPELSSITTMQGRLAVLLGYQALEAENPLGTRPMAHLAAGMVLANTGQRERAEAQVQLAADATRNAPEPTLVAAVRAIVLAWPEEGRLATGTLTAEQWTLVQERMGWFGSLARAKLEGDPVAQKHIDEDQVWLLYGIILAGVWFLGAGLAGLALVITLGVLAATGKVRSAMQAMPQALAERGLQRVLGETFICWMLLFLLLRVLVGRVGDDAPTAGSAWKSAALTFASLGALAWPLWRGVSWRDLRDVTGLRMPGNVWRLARLSAASYMSALPFMALGVLIGQWLAGVLGGRSFQDVSHPVQELLPGASVGMALALFFAASVAAPVVEETVFRGLLYGHVRQQTWGWPRWLSITAAMLFSATIFAAIHPQGVLAVPALAGVSIGFCITREWSGSVAPGMVAHGFHNGVLLAMNLLLNG